MKRPLLILLSLLCSFTIFAQTASDSTALATAQWHTTTLSNGAECQYTQVEVFDSQQSISVVRYPAGKFNTRIVHLDKEGRFTSDVGAECNADAAINAGYFNVKTLEPTTFVMIDKEVLGRTTPAELDRVNGIVAFRDKNGRKMEIFLADTTDYDDVAKRYRSAIAAGPVLVLDGEQIAYEYKADNWFYAGRHPRSVIGKNNKGEIIMLVIDGRSQGNADGATITETAFIAKQIGMNDALNLDGGGSSALWTKQNGVVNYPSDNRTFDHEGERPVPNFIITKSRK